MAENSEGLRPARAEEFGLETPIIRDLSRKCRQDIQEVCQRNMLLVARASPRDSAMTGSLAVMIEALAEPACGLAVFLAAKEIHPHAPTMEGGKYAAAELAIFKLRVLLKGDSVRVAGEEMLANLRAYGLHEIADILVMW